MRLSNEQDQAIIRSAIADSSASTLSFLSSMGQREAIAFGDGVAATMRMKFESLDSSRIPGSSTRDAAARPSGEIGELDLATIVDRMRHGGREHTVDGIGLGLATVIPAVPAGGSEQRPSVSRLTPYTQTDPDRQYKPQPRNDGRLFR
jgi:hypothetical protein